MGANLNMGGFDDKVAALMRSDGLRRGMRVGALYLRGKFGTYPAVSRRSIGQYLTERQRRFLWAASRAGDIEIPYRRGLSPGSERLGLRWEISAQNTGLTQVIGNPTSYINYVQGDEQSAYHRETGWRTIEDIIDDEKDTVFNIVQGEVNRDIRA